MIVHDCSKEIPHLKTSMDSVGVIYPCIFCFIHVSKEQTKPTQALFPSELRSPFCSAKGHIIYWGTLHIFVALEGYRNAVLKYRLNVIRIWHGFYCGYLLPNIESFSFLGVWAVCIKDNSAWWGGVEEPLRERKFPCLVCFINIFEYWSPYCAFSLLASYKTQTCYRHPLFDSMRRLY